MQPLGTVAQGPALPRCGPHPFDACGRSSCKGHSSGARADDRREIRLEGSASDQEAIDVRHADELCAILRRHTAPVLDAHAVGDVSATLGAQVLTDGFLRLLCLLRRGDLPRADGPHGLVRNDDVVPILDDGDDRGELALVDLVGLARFALLEQFPDAEDHLDALFLTFLNFLGGDLVSLAILRAALRVADQRPLDFEVVQMLGAPFARECAHPGVRHVLRGDHDAHALGLVLDAGEMHRRRGDDDLHLVGIERAPPPGGQEFGSFLQRRGVALPIAPDDRLAPHGYGGGGAGGGKQTSSPTSRCAALPRGSSEANVA
mmetsp:Transcript_13954/g.41468  ORF Transcript_13954/g.41468 Transcript_13954/m.41468 type:complete len:318 (+) Transcript_13954:1-954(+)